MLRPGAKEKLVARVAPMLWARARAVARRCPAVSACTPSLSRHHLLCHDPRLEMGNSPSIWSPAHFHSILPIVNHIKNSIFFSFLPRLLEPGKQNKEFNYNPFSCAKTGIIFQNSTKHNLFILKKKKNWNDCLENLFFFPYF